MLQNSICGENPFGLLSQAKLFDDITVTVDILLLQICKKVSSVTYHLEKSSTAVVVLVILFQMLGKIVDSACENSNLYFRRPSVFLIGAIALNDTLLQFFLHYVHLHNFSRRN